MTESRSRPEKLNEHCNSHTAFSKDDDTAEKQPLSENIPDYVNQAKNDKSAPQTSEVSNTAEDQSLPRVTATQNPQLARRQRPHKPPLLRILLLIQGLLFVTSPFIIVIYVGLRGPEKNEDRTTRQFKDKTAILYAFIGGLITSSFDVMIHTEIGEKPLLQDTSYRAWILETARLIAHYYFAFMYMGVFSGLYGGTSGHGEPLSGTNGTMWTNGTVWRNGTGGVQKAIGF